MNISVTASQPRSERTVYLKQINRFCGHRMLCSSAAFTDSHFLGSFFWWRRKTLLADHKRIVTISGRQSLYRASISTFAEPTATGLNTCLNVVSREGWHVIRGDLKQRPQFLCGSV